MTHEEILTTLGHYVDYLIAGSTAEAPLWNIEKVRSGKPNKWNYIDGCMITACLSLYKTTGDEKFLDFSKKFLDYFVKDNGVIETYDPAEYNLDNVNQGKNLFTLYDLTGDQRYRDAIETIRGQLETQPRTKEGNFWHKKIYPNQVWLDGTYMAQPFYMEYETRCNGMHGCIDSYKQFMNIQKHMKDAKTGLYYHGYDESREMYWANPETGCSANFWLRAMGWFLVAMVDTLERMDNQLYYEYRAIMAMLKDAVDAMIAFQDAESGMFWQVVDKPGSKATTLRPPAAHCSPTPCSRACVWATCPSATRPTARRRSTAPVTAIWAWTRTALCSWAASVWWPVSAARPAAMAVWRTISVSPSSRTTPRAWARCCWPTRKFWPHKSSKEGTLCRNLSSVPACTTTARAARTSCSGALPPTALPLCSWPIKSVCRPSGAMRT